MWELVEVVLKIMDMSCKSMLNLDGDFPNYGGRRDGRKHIFVAVGMDGVVTRVVVGLI